jgi:hypothetical protein
MLTLAVVDDLATIAIIAVFFSTDISLWWLLAAVAIVLAVLVARQIAVRSLVPYVVLAAALWYAVLESGVHATIAGVVLGFLTPAVAFHGRRTTAEAVRAALARVERGDADGADALLLETSRVTTDTVSPLARMETRLHPWSAYIVLLVSASERNQRDAPLQEHRCNKRNNRMDLTDSFQTSRGRARCSRRRDAGEGNPPGGRADPRGARLPLLRLRLPPHPLEGAETALCSDSPRPLSAVAALRGRPSRPQAQPPGAPTRPSLSDQKSRREATKSASVQGGASRSFIRASLRLGGLDTRNLQGGPGWNNVVRTYFNVVRTYS